MSLGMDPNRKTGRGRAMDAARQMANLALAKVEASQQACPLGLGIGPEKALDEVLTWILDVTYKGEMDAKSIILLAYSQARGLLGIH